MPRHEITTEAATGLGSKVAKKQKVKAGKSNIWNPDVCYSEKKECTTSSAGNVVTLESFPAPTCTAEFMRMTSTNWLRKQLHKLRKSHKSAEDVEFMKPAVMAVERWFMRYSLDHPHRLAAGEDPVLPMPGTDLEEIDPHFVDDLVKTGKDTQEAAVAVVKDFYTITRKAAVDILKKEKAVTQEETVVVIHHRHSCDVMLSKNKEKLLKINPAHYEKLKTIYIAVQESSSSSSSSLTSGKKKKKTTATTTTTTTTFDLAEFHRRLFCILARYHGIQGHGFQAACTEHVFDVLHGKFGVNMECFASPLNSRYASHCSAFPDTDACFGSLGSFFQFYPKQGSFEANPPFEPYVMLAMVNHMEVLFTKATGALSFIVVVPGWKESEAFQRLKSSKWNKKALPIAQKDHGFCDGAAHQRRDRYRISPYDTFFFFLQNDAAASKWPVTEIAINELRAAMACGVPSPSMQARHDKAGRGTDDIARGVYKGKKRKATGEGVMSRKLEETRLKKAGVKKTGEAKKHKRNT
jgi:hypothetical protein